MMDFLQGLNWQALLISAVITTFVVSAINTIQAKVSTNILVFIVATIVTLLNTTFIRGAGFAEWQRTLSELLFTMAFAVLFYNYAGKWFIDRLFTWLKKMLTDKFSKAGEDKPPTP
jgi:hypothetical protein